MYFALTEKGKPGLRDSMEIWINQLLTFSPIILEKKIIILRYSLLIYHSLQIIVIIIMVIIIIIITITTTTATITATTTTIIIRVGEFRVIYLN